VSTKNPPAPVASDAAATTASTKVGLLDRILENPQAGLLVALLVFGAVIAVQSDTFLTWPSIIEILR
jgi:hypothetical protein